ncbi:MAG: CBS domain-containing protein [Labilithrix sp.]|nr:CBS domain-containing protein [Labilithrix sp.]MCW5817271.1 CBS domain-containing protein [Labilithrix sp.]
MNDIRPGDQLFATLLQAVESTTAPIVLVRDVMCPAPQVCRPEDSLERAAQLMWEHACGSVAVVDHWDEPVAMLTDRDVCMAAYTQGRALFDLRVSSAMSKRLFTADVREPLADAERRMRCHAVGRLPVVGADGRLVGLLSLSDIARRAHLAQSPGRDPLSESSVAHTLAATAHAQV